MQEQRVGSDVGEDDHVPLPESADVRREPSAASCAGMWSTVSPFASSAVRSGPSPEWYVPLVNESNPLTCTRG